MKKRLLMTGLVLVFVMAVTVMFTGCGPANLQEFVETDTELNAQIEGIAAGSGMEIEIVENTMYFTATAEEAYEGDMMELAKEEYAKALEAEDEQFEAVVDDVEESTGFDVNLEIRFNDKSGTEILSKVYN